MIRKVIISVFILLLSSTIFLFQRNKALRVEAARLGGNQIAIFERINFYRTSDSLNAAEVDRLQLTVSELEKRNKSLAGTVESLNIKLKRVQAVSQTATSSTYTVSAPVRDSIIFRDRVDTVKCISYHNPWLTLDGCLLSPEIFSGNISTRDTIDQVIHRVPKKFWIFRYGVKAIRQEVVSRNPNSKIIFTEYIEISR